MKLDDQQFRNYCELSYSILQCYKDIAILNYFEMLGKDKTPFLPEVIEVVNHVTILAQKDLALTIWKIKLDNNPNANTVSKFRNKINYELKKEGLSVSSEKKTMLDKELENDLKRMRSQFLAHIDMYRNDGRIEIHKLKKALDVICKEFNSVCNKIDDDRVHEITDSNKMEIDICMITGMSLLFKSQYSAETNK